MLNHLSPENILFLDVETVPAWASYQEVPDPLKSLWDKKSEYFRNENQSAEQVYPRAGIYAEFGKIICISCGMIRARKGQRELIIKSYFGDDEKVLLEEFITVLEKFSLRKKANLCAHNGKEFDFPFLARRILINRLKLPAMLDTAGKKPWETNFLDTMELWRFGDFKHYTSLELLSHVFGIKSPKNDLDGSMVASVFYEEKNLKRIVSYCEQDVIALARLFLLFKGEEIIPDGHIQLSADH
jgi:3'-5' exonuclease